MKPLVSQSKSKETELNALDIAALGPLPLLRGRRKAVDEPLRSRRWRR
jgi:hypothetical protein